MNRIRPGSLVVVLLLAIVNFRVVTEGAKIPMEKATLAGGCFWCMEPPFENLEGVSKVISGYTGGQEKDPTYQQVSSGQTGHREAIQVTYDPKKITYTQLLEVFLKTRLLFLEILQAFLCAGQRLLCLIEFLFQLCEFHHLSPKNTVLTFLTHSRYPVFLDRQRISKIFPLDFLATSRTLTALYSFDFFFESCLLHQVLVHVNLPNNHVPVSSLRLTRPSEYS